MRILEHNVILREGYPGWPSIARKKDGELLIVFSGFREEHVCPYGKTVLLRSRDSGESWSDPEIINDTPLDDRDAGILVCSDGTIIVSWFTLCRNREIVLDAGHYSRETKERWVRDIEAIPPEEIDTWTDPGKIEPDYGRRGHFIRRSEDGGLTWGPPIAVVPSSPHGPIELSDGRLLYFGNGGYERRKKTSSLAAAESKDKGKTWEVIGGTTMFTDLPEQEADTVSYMGEPHAVEYEPGKILVLLRHQTKPYRPEKTNNYKMWKTVSEDGGYTWREPEPTPLLGYPPHLLELSDGRILATYGYRFPPYGERACVSSDGGRTWDTDREIVLRDDSPDDDLGYPASLELPGGEILTVYYQRDNPEEKPCLQLTRWEM